MISLVEDERVINHIVGSNLDGKSYAVSIDNNGALTDLLGSGHHFMIYQEIVDHGGDTIQNRHQCSE